MLLEGDNREDLLTAYCRVRQRSLDLCKPLEIEDYGVQPMLEASPPKWHLAHTTWFFETFILIPYQPHYRQFEPRFEYLFNSYYETVGDRHPRGERGNLSRPSVPEILSYRRHVDRAIQELLQATLPHRDLLNRIVLGLNHEQQHQELIITDLKCNLGNNPLRPAYYTNNGEAQVNTSMDVEFIAIEGGKCQIGQPLGTNEFCFDNETPEHTVWVNPFEIANRLVTNREFLEFIEDGGYEDPSLWLSDGWAEQQERNWHCPEYWIEQDGSWCEYTLAGEHELAPNQPVTHVSYYEADAFARWANARLPTEFEWEHVVKAEGVTSSGNLADDGVFHPTPATPSTDNVKQLFGDCWEWTQSSYSPYPGFAPDDGALGEYNGKFMANQLVLRGGSCATPQDHIRTTYRNFFYPKDRWQFTGIRLARSRG